ncbi:hypothetical protein QTI66_37430 [Variovorax sp. J22R133]|uniref:hypothetical protein n=1 Tax=Variovorax brevis TaxID=3053503 RepID=UPI00257883AC|nr:hypothetical protein [Variovorax sp. J22R133]MDM0117783.1 hypothetical protein [Variovorax sp. J22R133]
MTLSIALAYAALLLVALLALLASRWPAWMKGLLVVGVTVLYFHAWNVLDDVWGWPSGGALPERFVLLAAVIDEPHAKEPGGLHVWVHAIVAGKATSEPRAYRLPYTKEMHLQISEGTQKIRVGVSQMGITEPKVASTGLGWLRPDSAPQTFRLRDLPGPQLPEK